jgi:SAM-dependent methyltransferase
LTAEEDWNYFREASGLSDEQLAGKVVLDADCGSARLTRQIGERGADLVVGVDIIDAVDRGFDATRDLENVHIVQVNIFNLPLRSKAFDLVWSNGVIHKTPDTPRST